MAHIDTRTLSARPPANARVPLVLADKSIGAMLASAGGDPWMLGAVRVATTTNGTLATAYENGDTVDGVTLATGDRILLKNQSTGAENGIYTVNASGAPTRATDADGAGELYQGLKVHVLEGTTNARTTWKLTTSGTITIGSTAQVWESAASIAGLKGADIASATTTDLSAATGDFVDITGTTTITGLGTVAAGAEFTLRFTGALTVTHNGTSLILANAENMVTVAGDVLRVRSLGSGNWVEVGRRRATAVKAKDDIARQGSSIASASSIDLAAATGDFVDVTGTTGVTALGTALAGVERVVRFTGALTITHNGTSLILPGSTNFTTAAGDILTFRSLGSGNWVCTGVRRAAQTFQIPFEVMSDVSDTYRLVVNSAFAFTVVSCTYRTTASTVTLAVQIDGVNVTSLSSLSGTTSETTTAATGANTVAVGADVTLVTSSPGTSGSRVFGNLICTRA